MIALCQIEILLCGSCHRQNTTDHLLSRRKLRSHQSPLLKIFKENRTIIRIFTIANHLQDHDVWARSYSSHVLNAVNVDDVIASVELMLQEGNSPLMGRQHIDISHITSLGCSGVLKPSACLVNIFSDTHTTLTPLPFMLWKCFLYPSASRRYMWICGSVSKLKLALSR